MVIFSDSDELRKVRFALSRRALLALPFGLFLGGVATATRMSQGWILRADDL
jgi:hypothetical protein